MLQNIGLPEIVIVLLVVLIFFGPKYLKDLAGQLGEAGKELKNIDKEYKETITEIAKKPTGEDKKEKLINNKKSKKKGGDN
ncbi:MAG: twin-arginine translocase TatA/TatE family subunit [Patescibacteria group bacterium]